MPTIPSDCCPQDEWYCVYTVTKHSQCPDDEGNPPADSVGSGVCQQYPLQGADWQLAERGTNYCKYTKKVQYGRCSAVAGSCGTPSDPAAILAAAGNPPTGDCCTVKVPKPPCDGMYVLVSNNCELKWIKVGTFQCS